MDNSISMKDAITQRLAEIERQEKIVILHAVESGSRAWGFASPDSDYDVRFIYVRPKDFYLKLEKTRDVIEWQLDETLDIGGWDLQKALRLLHSSNPTLFEWASSPIVYKTTEQWHQIGAKINSFFLAKAGLYHYLSTAQSNYREYLKGEQVKLKKYFYVLRPLLACRWILAKNCPPPMLFSELKNTMLEPALHPAVDRLLAMKAKTPEMGVGARIDELGEYIDRSLVEIKALIDEKSNDDKQGWEQLNELFLRAVEASL
ncbi:MAG: nucleotidyltransferase domain-containing protein [Clostridium sp.]|jgi:predicted nucleotidyltransferase|nr:nucleotidyltransferase domain-containing protein [Clostridium sp.]